MSSAVEISCVNALLRAYSISTHLFSTIQYSCMYVSMPFFGLTPFLRAGVRNYERIVKSVSMPFFGLTPFLLSLAINVNLMSIGVNALLRAYSISTYQHPLIQTARDWCQCPSSGLLHFYLLMLIIILAVYILCQCPSSGLLHFYRKKTSKNQNN